MGTGRRRQAGQAIAELATFAARFYLFFAFALMLWVVGPTVALGWQPVAITTGSMAPRVTAGDVVVIAPYGGEALAPGHVITYEDPTGRDRLLTHRIVEVLPDGSYRTKGDANRTVDSALLPPDLIQGVARLLVPAGALPFVWLRGDTIVFVVWILGTLLAAILARRRTPDVAASDGALAAAFESTRTEAAPALTAGSLTWAAPRRKARSRAVRPTVMILVLVVAISTMAVSGANFHASLSPEGSTWTAGSWTTSCTPGSQTVIADRDAWINEQDPDKNYGTEDKLLVRSQAGQNNRTVLHFPLPVLPDGCEVSSAQLTVSGSAVAAGRTIDAYRATSQWTETGVTWNTQPSVAEHSSATADLTTTIDVTEQAANLYTDGNHGFLLRDAAEGDNGHEQQWSSRETNDPQRPAPKLTVSWSGEPGGSGGPGEDCAEETRVLLADQDTWINEQDPDKNYGTEDKLLVRSQTGQNNRALVDFPLPAVPDGCAITSAVLTVTAGTFSEGRTIDAYRATSAWTEIAVSWNSQPTVAEKSSAGASGTTVFDVTTQITAMYVEGDFGLSLRDAAEGGNGHEQQWSSRETADTQRPGPTLEITWASVP